MDFTQSVKIINPDKSELSYSNAYIYDDNSIATYRGDFLPNKKHIAIIPTQSCDVQTGAVAMYENKTRTVTAVCDNTVRSRVLPHIRLTLE
ncbi:MAG: hypothetical protein J6A69_12350 [Clostridia bacterium]|nr:hypothetical protein [Clostridia bacterium]